MTSRLKVEKTEQISHVVAVTQVCAAIYLDREREICAAIASVSRLRVSALDKTWTDQRTDGVNRLAVGEKKTSEMRQELCLWTALPEQPLTIPLVIK